MIVEFLTSKFFFIVTIIGAGVGFSGLVLYMNWSIGVTFRRDILPVLEKDPNALARYFGRRLLAAAIVAGFAVLAGAIV